MSLFKAAAISLGLISSNMAFAIFDAQLLVGQRSGKMEKDATSIDGKATEIQAAVHIDPIPLIPIAFGLFVSNQTYEKTIAFEEAVGAEIGVQVYAWLPLGIAGLKPYAKVGYPLYSAIKADAKYEVTAGTSVDYSYLLETAGPHISIGVAYSPLPLIALLFELDMGQQTIESKEFEGLPAGIPTDSLEVKYTYNNTAILVGAQVGL